MRKSEHRGRTMLRFQDALRLQARYLWLSRRPLWLLSGLISVLYLAGWATGPTTRLIRASPIWLLCVGPLWAFAVWHGEPPSRRQYMWSQPASRAHQSLARMLAGFGWLWAMLLGMLATGVVAAVMDGELDQLAAISLTGWTSLVVAVSMGYLATSCVTMAFENPFHWVFRLLLLSVLLLFLLEQWKDLFGFGVLDMLLALGDFNPFGLFRPWTRDVLELTATLRGQPWPVPSSTGISWWISWAISSAALCTVLWSLAHAHPDRLLRRKPKSTRESSGA